MASTSSKEPANGGKMRAARLSALQFEVLIEFMQQHPHFAVGRAAGGSYTKEEHDQLWRSLSSVLNETEGPVKSVTKWQKCWVDLKSNARSRAAKWRAMSLDGPSLPVSLFTQWDERVLRLLNDISANNNKFSPATPNATILAQSPLQLVEVGLSEVASSARVIKPSKGKFRSIAPKTSQSRNGYHRTDNGIESVEPVNSHDFNLLEDIHHAEEDVEELIAEVKSEEDEWPEETNDRCEEEYSLDSENTRNDTDSQGVRYLATHLIEDCSENPEEDSSEPIKFNTPKKRKYDDPLGPHSLDNSLERLSKKLCGALDRMAAAAEESNAIQHGMVSAMNRLASSFEQLIPAVVKVLSNHANQSGSP